ncbi:MAG: hypothetical protein U9R47_11270, partial [Actinomycetota bacterium]|nr:hypothetical protein [Actinomycetota bacterium]
MSDVSTAAGGAGGRVALRLHAVVRSVLPPAADVRIVRDSAPTIEIAVNGRTIVWFWIGEGTLGRAREVLRTAEVLPEVVVGRRMSPGARSLLSDAGVGWVDESGAAEISIGSLLVSRTGRPDTKATSPQRWTASAFAVAEAVLCGSPATVSAVASSTGLSTGACTKALRMLTDVGLLE